MLVTGLSHHSGRRRVVVRRLTSSSTQVRVVVGLRCGQPPLVEEIR
ncbi:hypothetical protein I553_1481 [Mycobacterium xenopi 4042]|uniref:Uncharacterized protein n=1 Tax=Mycobacterium xenopi 4042 TaxID=1299334 RepID=X8CH28_MYCXE|nr:hypothetical protein I553_1481 [Mycobacterium xenopi 4042]